ncbi:MAG: hypothetical protein JWR37_4843 [Mycobacterium sp.]|nr:hypothetical protein [Mycobacterium sp.]
MIRTLVVAAAIAAATIGAAPTANAAPFKNCTAAEQAGRCNIPSDDPMYGPWLDRDHDGIGCEC